MYIIFKQSHGPNKQFTQFCVLANVMNKRKIGERRKRGTTMCLCTRLLAGIFMRVKGVFQAESKG